MAVGACTHSIIVVLHNDGLLAGIPAGEKDHHLPGLQGQADASAGGAAAQAVRKHQMQGQPTFRNLTMLSSSAAAFWCSAGKRARKRLGRAKTEWKRCALAWVRGSEPKVRGKGVARQANDSTLYSKHLVVLWLACPSKNQPNHTQQHLSTSSRRPSPACALIIAMGLLGSLFGRQQASADASSSTEGSATAGAGEFCTAQFPQVRGAEPPAWPVQRVCGLDAQLS